MITKFRLFEINETSKPEVDDYVICKTPVDTFPETIEMVKDNIGQVQAIKEAEDKYYRGYTQWKIGYFIEYESGTINVAESEILYWAKDREELESILTAKKYNI